MTTDAHTRIAMYRRIRSRRARLVAPQSAGASSVTESSTAVTEVTLVHLCFTMPLKTVQVANVSAGVLAQKRDVVLASLFCGLTDHRRIGCVDHRGQQLRIDLPSTEIRVAVGTGAGRIA